MYLDLSTKKCHILKNNNASSNSVKQVQEKINSKLGHFTVSTGLRSRLSFNQFTKSLSLRSLEEINSARLEWFLSRIPDSFNKV